MDNILKQLYPLQVSYLFGEFLTSSLILLWFYKQGVTFNQMIMFYILLYTAGITTIAIGRTLFSKSAFIISLLLKITVVMIYILGFKSSYLPLIAVLTGPLFLLFWINYNIRYFSNINKEKKAFGSAIYVSAFTVLSALCPIIAGFIASEMGMNYVFWAGLALFLITIIFVLRTEKAVITCNVFSALKCMKGVRTMIFLEGFWEHITFVAIPLLSIFFIKDELGLGAYLSYLGLMGALASLGMAKLSDRLKKRKKFLYPLAIALSAATFLLMFGSTLKLWILFTGMIYVLSPALKPFQTAVSLDNAKCSIQQLMTGREFLLNIGRLTGVIVFLAAFTAGLKYASFAFAGFAMLAYPFVSRYKGHYKKD